MLRTVCVFLGLLVSLSVLGGCSSGKGDPVTPQEGNLDALEFLNPAQPPDTNHQLLGQWNAEFDPDTLTASVTENRSLLTHVNATQLIPPPGIVVNEFNPATNVIDVYVTLENPYDIDVNDVRLIIYTDDAGHLLLNPDCWTNLYDIPGGEIINPFVAYAKQEDHRIFSGHSEYTENLLVYLPQGNMNVKFAVDVSAGDNCEEPYSIDNFQQERLFTCPGRHAEMSVDVYDWHDADLDVFLHCPEVTGHQLTEMMPSYQNTWKVDLLASGGTQPGEYQGYVIAVLEENIYKALYLPVSIYLELCDTDPPVWDSHPGITGLTVEDGAINLTWGTATDVQTPPVVYELYIDYDDNPWDRIPYTTTDCEPVTFTGLSHGQTYWLGVRCRDSFDPPNYDHNRNVMSGGPTGPGDHWGRTWGSFDHPQQTQAGYIVKVADSGDIYTTGYFEDPVDFDPGPGYDGHYSNGSCDIFLSKFDSNGVFKWAKTWGGTGKEFGRALALDSLENIYVAGYFRSETIDFDPGSPVDEYQCAGQNDAFMCKFDKFGNYEYALVWGGSYGDESLGISTDQQDNLYITGRFEDLVDFDPGPGVTERFAEHDEYSSYSMDAFLSKFSSDGEFQWVKTWGGSGSECGLDVSVDSFGNIFTAGFFVCDGIDCKSTDFDPGSGMDLHISNGAKDAYLSKFDSSGNYHWVLTWGGSDNDLSTCISHDSENFVYVLGSFEGEVDLDPGPGIDIHIGDVNNSLSKFNLDGDYIWAVNVTGGTGLWHCGKRLSINSADQIFVVSHSSGSPGDFELSQLNTNGDFLGSQSWGGYHPSNLVFSVDTDNEVAVYLTGIASSGIDFDPGPGLDWHVTNGVDDIFLMKYTPGQ